MVEIGDIETYKDAFIYCGLNRDTLEKSQFEISNRKNELPELINHLNKLTGLIGYNIIDFDYPVLHWLLNNWHLYDSKRDGKILANDLYTKANEIINSHYSAIKYSEIKIPLLDLIKIWHYQNPARFTSLKFLEFTMRSSKIESLPYKPDQDLTNQMIDKIIEYCHYDVNQTYQFYLKSSGRIKLRKDFVNKYNYPSLINRPDVGIAEDLTMKYYCELTGKNRYDVKDLRSTYNVIKGNDVILPLIKFQSPLLQEWLINLKNTTLKNNNVFWKGTILNLYGNDYQIGLGGIHIIQESLQYKAKNNEFIIESDCSGMYPTFICNHNQFPAHLGKEFLIFYKDIREKRMLAKKTGDKVMDAAGKLIGNGLFGKFGSDTSFLFDLKMLYTTTLNNQLFLLMLIEQCGLNNIRIISANTDSITVYIDKSTFPKYESIIKKWEEISLHTMEHTYYNFIVYRDVNNYICETIDSKCKFKGCFDTFEDSSSDKFDGWHKDQSMLIVPIALKQYYCNNILPEYSIPNHSNIYDFCKCIKAKGDNSFIARTNTINSVDKPLQKVVRYIISKEGIKLIKILPPIYDEDGNNKADKVNKAKKKGQTSIFDIIDDVKQDINRESEIESGYLCTILNKIEDDNAKNYDINYDYYINECYKIINKIK